MGIVSILIALGALGVSVSTKRQTVTPSPTNTTVIDNSPTKVNTTSRVLPSEIDVITLNENKEVYAGKTISVRGEIQINPQYGEWPCPENEPQCETLAGIDLYLAGKPLKANMGSIIRIYKSGKPYPCSKKGKNFICGNFVNGETRTVAGIWVKSREPEQTVGNSSGTVQVLKWRDFYYLEIN